VKKDAKTGFSLGWFLGVFPRGFSNNTHWVIWACARMSSTLLNHIIQWWTSARCHYCE